MAQIVRTPEECYATIVEAFDAAPEVTQWAKKTFGSKGLSIKGKIFAMLLKGKLVLKLPKPRVDALVASGQGERFELGKNRLMKEWVTVEPTAEEIWLPLAREALEFVASKS